MNFKSWFILSEELYQNNTATIFHRTRSFEDVQQMMNGGFRAGGGDHHGPGLYTTYTLKGTTNLGQYGPYVVKLKVKNLKEYFVLEPDVAKKIHGDNYKLKDQARILNLTLKLTDEEWQKYQEISEKGQFGSAAASRALKQDFHFLWVHGCKGIIYNGAQDGKCICVYAPYEGLQFLAYANAPAPTTVDFIEKNWIKSGRDVSIRSTVNIRSISGFKFPNNIGSTSVKKQYEIENPENQKNTPPNMFDDVKDGKYSRAKLYVIKNELSNMDVNDFLRYADDKEKMARILGPDNINKLDNQNVNDFLRYADDKGQIARILGPDNINKLSEDNIFILLGSASDIDEIARILGPDNINKLTYGGVHILLSHADNKGQMARILGPDNINKLDSDDFSDLLMNARDKKEMAEILGPDNINKISGDHVSALLYNTSNMEEMVRILGREKIDKLDGQDIYRLLKSDSYNQSVSYRARILGEDNINKLNGEEVFGLINLASNKGQMARILGQENINKLNGDAVSHLLRYTFDKEKMAEMLGKENINKLDDRDVGRLILLASNKYEMAKALDIKKLSDDNISTLIFKASNRYEMAELIINEKPELSKRNIRDLRRGLGTVKANNLINHKEEEKEENPIVKFRRPSGKYKHKLEWIDNFLT